MSRAAVLGMAYTEYTLLKTYGQRRRKLFNVWGWGGGVKASKANFYTWGGRVIAKSTYMHACTHTCMHMHVHTAKCSYNHACPHNVCMCMHAYAHIHLYPYMKIIEIKASDLFAMKKSKYIHVILLEVREVKEETFMLLHCIKAILISLHI